MRMHTYGGLDVYIAGGPDREGGGNGPLVILLHGFGAPGDDLVALWRMLRVPDDVRFMFPVAPLTLDQGLFDGRAWWMLDMDLLARQTAQGRRRDIDAVPDGLTAARERVLAMLDDFDRHEGLPRDRTFIGGFSQGAMLACDTVLRSPRGFAGLIILSGSIIARPEWEAQWPARKGLPVFQSHGTDDPILPHDVAIQLKDSLLAHGLPVTWHEFRGGHEIPFPVLEQLGLFLVNACGPP
ncbi:MAG: hypothetical protein F4201_07695 [Nitrospira sp. SB0677_bin_15]|nr:hypothetical protein [Nitrospira sp. SB0667_bin_9]MYD32184.1 hypothetical protein [Nitrospira sp. SB0661_bin_20]MYG40677.1 hypothetical protein [Nitrospira sp. SB0677_bin_15]MYJ23686.1 hypothetical protein [Nitrospira sp. SB0673_bin_12]